MKVNPLVILVICVVLSGAKYVLVDTQDKQDKTPSAHDDDTAQGDERTSDDYIVWNPCNRNPRPKGCATLDWAFRNKLHGK